ncbi:MAG: CPBP family intramembrane metalloprotease [Chitinophagia bacterium]|nr:CPBP family intramembrane metalloprotease [Chitinophagia bacterium]
MASRITITFVPNYMKYFRYYPWAMQLILMVTMSFTFYFFGLWLLQTLLPKVTGVPLETVIAINAQSPYAVIRAGLVMLGVLSLLRFTVTGFVFAYLAHPRPIGYLGLRKPYKVFQVVLAALIMVAFIPALEWLQDIISHIDFGKAVKENNAENERLMQGLLTMPDVGAFILAVTVLAAIPAFGEELFFRGIVMRFAARFSIDPALPVIITALIFAASHSGNIYGMPSIFIAGFLLGLIYYLTGSLWCSIAGHLCFNAASLAMAFAATHTGPLQHFLEGSNIPWWLVAASVGVGGSCLYLLYLNQTPLPAGWTADFDHLDSEDDLLTP